MKVECRKLNICNDNNCCIGYITDDYYIYQDEWVFIPDEDEVYDFKTLKFILDTIGEYNEIKENNK